MRNLVSAILVILALILGFLFIKNLDSVVKMEEPAVIEQMVTVEPVEEREVKMVTKSFVQLSSHSSKEEAKNAISIHERSLGKIVGKGNLQVYSVILSGKEWFRVVLPMKGAVEANSLCKSLKDRGVDCLSLSFVVPDQS